MNKEEYYKIGLKRLNLGNGYKEENLTKIKGYYKSSGAKYIHWNW